MNERMAELFGQAGISDSINEEFGIEYLAELIIRECAEICYHHSRAAGGIDTAFGYGYKDCGDDIKQHLGVEE